MIEEPGGGTKPVTVGESRCLQILDVERGHTVKHEADSIEPKLAFTAELPDTVAFSWPAIPIAYCMNFI
jgi:hypothetical protein